MDISVLKKKSLRVWVPFVGDTRIQVRFVSRTEIQAISDLCTTNNLVDSKLEEKFDNAKFNDEICKLAVTDLENFDDDGQPFPCTPANVLFLAKESSLFVTTVRSTCTDLEKLLKIQTEELKKNSGDTSPPASTIQA